MHAALKISSPVSSFSSCAYENLASPTRQIVRNSFFIKAANIRPTFFGVKGVYVGEENHSHSRQISYAGKSGHLRAEYLVGVSMTGVHGINPANTIGLLKERTELIQRGIKPSDERRIGLIVEGGAMRGVISCAALQGLEELGMTQVFDQVYGASAGAVNAAYFLAGQAGYATTIYYQKVNTTRFIRRMWHRQVVDLDELFDSIVGRERPLLVQKVQVSRSEFFIVVADAITGQSFLAHAQSSSV